MTLEIIKLFCPYPTPQYYPNVVTVDAGAEPTRQAGLIAELARDGKLNLSGKDETNDAG
jgi:hypothetical protein